ncbi:putative bifunctional diguanylate cyclase/phosphodiesterase [Colwellia hornerae]|uniref:EAL domain-containing protein n=1 Tax=Colwellia hornerae TaxID=89402 RepID=A0A5C6Q2B7_9GAMM|nr:EAL domain-containing protein [Colwellia hornerae]TWX45846.1 EAL domain-containing protein [Colwellia hornerae]TWX53892.1 EAL domain-containing protein [Colwellia hornerae]TWX63016.1 EAL domain-containing protein [Colwellia hornerae]
MFGLKTNNDKRADELIIANKELTFQVKERDKRADELIIANKEKDKRADELIIANKEKDKRADELIIANKEKDKRADELIIANKEKDKRADELVIANKEKDKRADELVIANKELTFQVKEKDKRADELVIANKEKDKRADELVIANKEKDKRADELVIANKEKDKRADELVIANKELAFQNKEKDKRADELVIANKEKDKRADELVIANKELAFQNKEKDKRAEELVIANKEKDKQTEDLVIAASVFTHAREGISITDTTGTIVDVNDMFTTITGYSKEEAIGQNSRILESTIQSPEFYVNMWQAILKDGFWSGEVWNCRKNGEVYPEMLNISSVKDVDGQIIYYVALFTDITPMKEHQNQLEHIAHYDLLTNLPNRVLLADRLSQAMLQCSRNEQSLAVVFLDLDGFKAVNDAHGHDMGDELLIALSLRMKAALREGDTLARIGGDEFIAVLADLSKVEDCEPVLERLLLAASESVKVGDVIVNISTSIGVTLYPQDAVNADQLIRHADQAMYVAKESGKNRYHLFDTAQDEAIKVQRESLEAIRSALDEQQFVLYYQPKVNMKTGSVMGVEALIRWQHPKRGLLNPIDFLPVIENNPMSIEMGEWVIDNALTQISQWQTKGLNLPVSISVNIAAVQLQQPDFTQRLTTLLAAHPDVEPRYLELEVLETSALDDVQHVSTTMINCIALGVSFALDDFGTGYSSLTYLRRLPAKLIKIDQSFVRDMLSDTDDFAIVEGVIALAKSFKREVIAEGVETIEHGKALLQLGCHLAQGYGIAKPMPACDVPTWVNDWKPDASWQV